MQEKKKDPTKTQKTEVLASCSAGLRLGDLKKMLGDQRARGGHRPQTTLQVVLGPKNRLLTARVGNLVPDLSLKATDKLQTDIISRPAVL